LPEIPSAVPNASPATSSAGAMRSGVPHGNVEQSAMYAAPVTS